MTGIDLYAGLGGSTEGAEQAGVRIVWMGNHWRAVVEIAKANHPEAVPVCQDMHQARWIDVPKTDVGLASPCCQGHTAARGKDRPHHDASRSTAWAPLACAEVHRQPVWVIENVPAFLKWTLFPSWADAWARLGYALAPHIIDAADHGVPQNRVRVFIVATLSKAPLWLKLPKREHVAAETILDAGGTWSAIATKCERTRARVRRGRREIGPRFLMCYYGSGSGLTGRSLARPVGTITTLDRWAIVDGRRMRMLSVDECRRAMGFRADYILPESSRLAKHMLGNAVCPPVMRDVLTAIKEAA